MWNLKHANTGGGGEPFAATHWSTAKNLNFLFLGKQGESDVSLSDFHQPFPLQNICE